MLLYLDIQSDADLMHFIEGRYVSWEILWLHEPASSNTVGAVRKCVFFDAYSSIQISEYSYFWVPTWVSCSFRMQLDGVGYRVR